MGGAALHPCEFVAKLIGKVTSLSPTAPLRWDFKHMGYIQKLYDNDAPKVSGLLKLVEYGVKLLSTIMKYF